MKKLVFASAVLLCASSCKQPTQQAATYLPPPEPPEKPRQFVDTTYSAPSNIVRVHNAAGLQAAIDKANYGTTIVLDSGATYVGNWQVKPKVWANGWIYIISSKFLLSAGAPPPHPVGKRVTNADAPDMAKLVTALQPSVFMLEPKLNLPAASHIRFVGLEITTSSEWGAVPDNKPWPINGQSPVLVSLKGTDSITIDRCFIHGDKDHDVIHAVIGFQGASNIAIVDSEISEIHTGGMDAQAFVMTASQGPVKLLNNKLSASTEDVMFGGAGVGAPPPFNGMVPSDIEIRNNWFWKDEAWIPRTTGNKPQWTVKNNLEFKSADRVLVVGNTLENAWASGQYGSNVLITPRSYQSGPNTVVDDIDIESNTMLNANWSFSISGWDSLCIPPQCTNPGESVRVKITNNMIKLRSINSPASYKPLGFSIGKFEREYEISSNTITSMDSTKPWAGIFMNQPKCPNVDNQPYNLWIMNNVFPKQITGDCGYTGDRALNMYMPDPPPPQLRYTGNTTQ